MGRRFTVLLKLLLGDEKPPRFPDGPFEKFLEEKFFEGPPFETLGPFAIAVVLTTTSKSVVMVLVERFIVCLAFGVGGWFLPLEAEGRAKCYSSFLQCQDLAGMGVFLRFFAVVVALIASDRRHVFCCFAAPLPYGKALYGRVLEAS